MKVRNEKEYSYALKLIKGLMMSEPDTIEFDLLIVLSNAVENYEKIHYPELK